jgi:hypothetical protein
VLAAADLDGDGDTDVVTPHGIFRREAGDAFVRVYARTLGDAWAEAVVADVDGDGGPEVIVTVAQASEDCAPVRMQALVETDGAYAAELVRDVGLPRDLRRGDFDGDGIDDLAAIEPGPEDTRVAVLFGDPKEPLEDVTSVGGFDSVSALAAVRSRDATEINEDLVGDLAIVSENGEFLTMVTGSTTRTLLSPLTFDPAGAEVGRRAAQTLVGSLLPHPEPDDDDALPPDVLAIADTRAWLVRDDDVHHGDDPLAVDLSGTGIRASCAVWSIGPARADEASVWAGVDGRAPRVSGVTDDCDLSTAPTMVVARLSGSRAEPQLRFSTGSLGNDARRPTSIEVFDLDASGVDDIVVHTSHVGDTRRGNLWVVLDPEPGSGALHAISPPVDGDVLAATALNADADETLELAVLTTTGLFILESLEPGSFGSSGPVFELPRAPVGDEWVSLVAGDFDGNDLFDLGLLVGDAVYLYPAIERE